MKINWLVLSTGFALFSMFFGSGNLVFPITVGQESDGHYLMGAMGILATGVLVPFLGVLGMMLYKGDIYSFFKCFGKNGTFVFSFLALALMGPFGVLARCLTVAHGALLILVPNIPLPLTSLGICVLIYFLAVNKNQIIPVLGTYLTPFLLLSIAAIAFFGLMGGSLVQPTNTESLAAFKTGFLQGYQTMDLLAAFFFSQFVIKHLYNSGANTHPVFFKAALIGAGILSAVYGALVLLGWIYSPILLNQPPQEMLGLIAQASLGAVAGPCVCLAVIFACLTTAIVLASLFSEFLHRDVMAEKLGSKPALIVTLVIAFLVSTLDFAGIAAFLGPILEAVYPALITLTIVNISSHYIGLKATHWPFTLTLAAKLCFL